MCVSHLSTPCRRTRGSWRRWRSACGRRSWCPTWARWTLRRSRRSWRRATRSPWKITGGSSRGWRRRPDATGGDAAADLSCARGLAAISADLSCNPRGASSRSKEISFSWQRWKKCVVPAISCRWGSRLCFRFSCFFSSSSPQCTSVFSCRGKSVLFVVCVRPHSVSLSPQVGGRLRSCWGILLCHWRFLRSSVRITASVLFSKHLRLKIRIKQQLFCIFHPPDYYCRDKNKNLLSFCFFFFPFLFLYLKNSRGKWKLNTPTNKI